MVRCAICGKRDADKTNSHIIPSFLISMVASADNSYQRDKEILYSIGTNSIRPYIGRNVSSEAIERNFTELTDDDLSAMKENNASKDYIFCSQCEKSLGDYLESPYASTFKNNKRIKPEESYFFWLSVLWRMNEFDSAKNKLGVFIANRLRKSLFEYIKKRNNRGELKLFFPFKYKVLYCRDFCRNNAGMIYLHYDKRYKIASAFFGDFVVCFIMRGARIPKYYKFYGLERCLRKAPVNEGTFEESRLNISEDRLERAYSNLINEYKIAIEDSDRDKVYRLWQMLLERGLNIPTKPSEVFVNQCLLLLHNSQVKIGDRLGYRYFAKCFNDSYRIIYGISLVV